MTTRPVSRRDCTYLRRWESFPFLFVIRLLALFAISFCLLLIQCRMRSILCNAWIIARDDIVRIPFEWHLPHLQPRRYFVIHTNSNNTSKNLSVARVHVIFANYYMGKNEIVDRRTARRSWPMPCWIQSFIYYKSRSTFAAAVVASFY